MDWQAKQAKEAIDLARGMSDFVNGSGDLKTFVEEITMKTHRTLQQYIFKLFLHLVRAWATTEYFDGRNEYTVKKCKEIMEKVDGMDYDPPCI